MMASESLLCTVASNTLISGAIAIIAFAIMKSRRVPSLAHVLWVLALIKLLTPPIAAIPMLPQSDSTTPMAEQLAALASSTRDSVAATEDNASSVDAESASPPATRVDPAGDDSTSAATMARLEAAVTASTAEPLSGVSTWLREWQHGPWSRVVFALWAAGAIAVVLLALWRVLAFRRGLREANPASDALHQELSLVAERLGATRVPSIEVLPCRLSPMLWAGFGRARILLPRGFEESLTTEQRRTLLAHELAHYVRRDHYVRWIEAIVVAVHWWNPLVWWARRQLHVAEEACCDAWVVWALPGSARRYADALIDTMEMLARDSRLPVMASGAVRARDLKERLQLIMNEKSARTHGRLARVGVLLVALVAIPTAFAQRASDDRHDATLRALERAIELLARDGDADGVATLSRLRTRVAHADRAPSGPRDYSERLAPPGPRRDDRVHTDPYRLRSREPRPDARPPVGDGAGPEGAGWAPRPTQREWGYRGRRGRAAGPRARSLRVSPPPGAADEDPRLGRRYAPRAGRDVYSNDRPPAADYTERRQPPGADARPDRAPVPGVDPLLSGERRRWDPRSGPAAGPQSDRARTDRLGEPGRRQRWHRVDPAGSGPGSAPKPDGLAHRNWTTPGRESKPGGPVTPFLRPDPTPPESGDPAYGFWRRLEPPKGDAPSGPDGSKPDHARPDHARPGTPALRESGPARRAILDLLEDHGDGRVMLAPPHADPVRPADPRQEQPERPMSKPSPTRDLPTLELLKAVQDGKMSAEEAFERLRSKRHDAAPEARGGREL